MEIAVLFLTAEHVLLVPPTGLEVGGASRTSEGDAKRGGVAASDFFSRTMIGRH